MKSLPAPVILVNSPTSARFIPVVNVGGGGHLRCRPPLDSAVATRAFTSNVVSQRYWLIVQSPLRAQSHSCYSVLTTFTCARSSRLFPTHASRPVVTKSSCDVIKPASTLD